MADAHRHRLDDLRRLGAALLAGHGVEPARASAFVAGLLWYEAAGADRFGIAALPGWIDAIESGEVDPKSEGIVLREHTATAVLDGQNGLSPLILSRAARIAGEKAREVGVGMVRVVGVGRVEATAEVVSEIALGPMVGTITGPMGYLAVAMPAEGTMPAVFDSALAREAWTGFPPWSGEPFGGWLVTARAVSAFESLSSVHEHVATLLTINKPFEGEVRPEDWQRRRLDHLEHGLTLPAEVDGMLRERAARLGGMWPS